MKRILAALVLMLTLSPSWAGDQVGTISYVIVRASDGLVYFGLNGTKTGSPTCASNGYWMIRDENSNAGKQQYAMLLSAQAAGKQVRISGSNTCYRWGDGEDVNWIQILE